MTPLQASVLLNEAIDLLTPDPGYPASEPEALYRLISFRDGFFGPVCRKLARHPVKVPGIPQPIWDCYGCQDTGWTDLGLPCPSCRVNL